MSFQETNPDTRALNNPLPIIHKKKNNLFEFEKDLINSKSFIGVLKRNLIGIPNISNYMSSMKAIKNKIFQDDGNADGVSDNEEEIFNLESELDFVMTKNNVVKNNFCLIDHIIDENKSKPYLNNEEYDNLLKFGECTRYRYSNQQRKRAIQKYKEKKLNRKNSTYVRYKIRKDLAEKRKRHKGKFIKKKKINLKKAFNDYIENKKINKDMKKLKI